MYECAYGCVCRYFDYNRVDAPDAYYSHCYWEFMPNDPNIQPDYKNRLTAREAQSRTVCTPHTVHLPLGHGRTACTPHTVHLPLGALLLLACAPCVWHRLP